MAIRINRYHEPADLSAHRGLLLNTDFGWHEASLVGDFTGSPAGDLKALRARADRRERRLRVAGASVSVLALVLGLALIGLL